MMLANHGLQRVCPSMHDVRAMARNVVSEQPLAIVFAAFGMGIGVGWLISDAACVHKMEPAAKVRQLVGAISRMLPEAIARHMSR